MRRLMEKLEDFTLWLVKRFHLESKLEQLVNWAAGKVVVAEAEKAVIRSFIEGTIDEDLPEDEQGAWGEDAREYYLDDPDKWRDSREDR